MFDFENSIHIKDCPFCGSRPRLIRPREEMAVLICSNFDCQASLASEPSGCFATEEMIANDVKQVVQKWNRRTSFVARQPIDAQSAQNVRFDDNFGIEDSFLDTQVSKASLWERFRRFIRDE